MEERLASKIESTGRELHGAEERLASKIESTDRELHGAEERLASKIESTGREVVAETMKQQRRWHLAFDRHGSVPYAFMLCPKSKGDTFFRRLLRGEVAAAFEGLPFESARILLIDQCTGRPVRCGRDGLGYEVRDGFRGWLRQPAARRFVMRGTQLAYVAAKVTAAVFTAAVPDSAVGAMQWLSSALGDEGGSRPAFLEDGGLELRRTQLGDPQMAEWRSFLEATTEPQPRFGGLERAIIDEDNDLVWTLPYACDGEPEGEAASGGAPLLPPREPDWEGTVLKQGRRLSKLWSSRHWKVWRMEAAAFRVKQGDHDFVISDCTINAKEQVEGRDGSNGYVRRFRLVDDVAREFWQVPRQGAEGAETANL